MAKAKLSFYTHPGIEGQQAHLDGLTFAQVRWKRNGHVAGFAPYKTGNPRRPYGVVAWQGPKPANLRELIAKKVAEQSKNYKGVSLQKYKTKQSRSKSKTSRRTSKRPTKKALIASATALYSSLDKMDRKRKSGH
jgi:hypothetical protein